MPTHTQYMYMAIKDQANNIVMELAQKDLDKDKAPTGDSSLDFYKCVPKGDYLLHCESPAVNGYGWSDSYMDFYLDDAPMGHCNIERSYTGGPVIYEAALHCILFF